MGLNIQRDGAWNRVGMANSVLPPAGVGYSLPQQQYGSVAFAITFDNNLLFVHARQVTRDVMINEIGCWVNSAVAGAVVRLGLYDCDDNGQPSNLLVDAGTVDASTSGVKIISLSPSIRVNAGTVYAASACQGAAVQLRGARRQGALPIPTNSTSNFFNNMFVQTLYQGASGAFPATFTPTGPAQRDIPLIWLGVGEVL